MHACIARYRRAPAPHVHGGWSIGDLERAPINMPAVYYVNLYTRHGVYVRAIYICSY